MTTVVSCLSPIIRGSNMNRPCASLLAVIIGVSIPLLSRGAESNDPIIGSWTLDVAHSTIRQGSAPIDETAVYEMTADGAIKVSSDGESASGARWAGELATYRYDGKDYALRSYEYGDTLAVTRVDSRTSTAVFKREGKIVGHMKCVVSRDGRKLTETIKGTDSTGKKIAETFVFRKQ
jgi:hypothetical protein